MSSLRCILLGWWDQGGWDGCNIVFLFSQFSIALLCAWPQKSVRNTIYLSLYLTKQNRHAVLHLSRKRFCAAVSIVFSSNTQIFNKIIGSLVFANTIFLFIFTVLLVRDSVVSIATGYGLDDRGVSLSPSRVKNFLFSTASRPALGPTQPAIQWVPGVKLQGREADQSPPTSAEVNKMWIYTSTPPLFIE
jgi:hypothetical protein